MAPKISRHIALIVAVILVAAAAYFLLGAPSRIKPAPTPTPLVTPIPTPTATPAPTQPAVRPEVVKTEVIKCEICHKDSQELTKHKNGGQYCVTCHGSQTHNIHVGAGTVNLGCEACHGFPPIVPTAEKGHVICENCHAPPPDSLKPSGGNLIVVHLSRNKYCTVCHSADIVTIHKTAVARAENRTTQK